MRRKSERNKAKSSPEKKPEKPTRKSTRRRTRKSPSTSPERSSNEKQQSPCKRQTRLRSKERTPTPTTAAVATTTIELMTPVIEETEAKVSSTELLLQTTPKKQDGIDDGGSVWKVARADASPGQIQKLKICRQRNLSETSDVSLSKKRGNKWQECGESVDSADEPPTPSNEEATIIDNNHGSIDDTSSSAPGRESGEEVSDSKEIPSEITTVDISDVKNNIDKQQQQQKDGQGKEEERKEDDYDDDEDGRAKTTTSDDGSSKKEFSMKNKIQRHDEFHGVGKVTKVPEENQRDSPTENVESSITTNDEKIENEDKGTKKEEKVTNIEKEIVPENDLRTKKASSFSGDDKNNDNDQNLDEKCSNSTEKSNDESKDVETITTSSRPVHLTRRKHRDKYRSSSNSESGDSDDEPRRQRERSEINTEKEEESKIVDIKVSESLKDSKSPVIESNLSESPSDEHLDIHADTDKEKSSDVDDNDDSNKKTSDNDETKNDQVDKPTTLEKIQTVMYRPGKVSLKRSFSRASVDMKKEDADTLNDPSQDKENHVSEVPKIIPKRRRWGTSALSVDTTPVLSISTDSLRALVPGTKPLSMSEVRLTKDDDETRERRRDYDKHETNNVEKDKEDTGAGKSDISKDNHSARRKVSIGKDTLTASSPPSAQLSSILFIKNLVRPFTMTQLKELLFRTGTIVEDGFWMDRIKSKAYVQYMNEDQAFETRQALHGISWPLSNPKKLIVEYATREAMNEAKELFKDQVPSRKVEATSGGDGWPRNWDRDEKSNSTTNVVVVREWDLGKEDDQHLGKDKERDKKDNEKKRRQRSRSPINDAHLPAPARKFKKKEDDAPPAKLLDDLFKKTKATPCVYWLPLTNEQVVSALMPFS